MVSYWVKTPKWLPRFFPETLIWKMPPAKEPAIYLTFDDGPHPDITPFVLDELKKYEAHASFFCIGKNVTANPAIYERILAEGHAVGNHTHNHFNGWKTDNHSYYANILKAARHIKGYNFRPPYGRIKISQARKLSTKKHKWRIYMWDVLSGDFDISLTPEQCLENVIQHMEPGSIVVFHDSEKAFPRMQYALPRVLAYCREQRWGVKSLPE